MFEKQIRRCIRLATGKSTRQILSIFMRQIVAGGSERKRKGKQGKERKKNMNMKTKPRGMNRMNQCESDNKNKKALK